MTANAQPRPVLVFHQNIIRAHLPPKYWDREADYFIASVEYNTLALSAAAAPAQFTTQNDSDFLVWGLSAIEATTAAGTTEQTYWPITCRILDSGSGASWFDQLQHLHNIFGRGTIDGQGYREMKYPRLVIGGSTVTVELSNLEATARRVWLCFHGTKIFRRPRV